MLEKEGEKLVKVVLENEKLCSNAELFCLGIWKVDLYY